MKIAKFKSFDEIKRIGKIKRKDGTEEAVYTTRETSPCVILLNDDDTLVAENGKVYTPFIDEVIATLTMPELWDKVRQYANEHSLTIELFNLMQNWDPVLINTKIHDHLTDMVKEGYFA